MLLFGLVVLPGCGPSKEERAIDAYNRGVAHDEIGESDKAIDDLTEAIRLNPEYVEAYTYTQIGDDGLEHLKGLTGLVMLDLRRTQVTDDGVAHLKGLTNLRELHLPGEQVTDAEVNELKKALPKVRIPR